VSRRLPVGARGRWRDGHASRVTHEAARAAVRLLREAIARAIALQLARHDIATAELAAALGVSSAAVKKWTLGRQIPSLSRLLTIAMAIRCKLTELIPDISAESPNTPIQPHAPTA
jgi:transcriptional regulator with XRE-family HTH domain